MSRATSVLFICTGNIFRSMTAEFALRHHLGVDSPVVVSSAGIEEAPHGVMDFVAAHLRSHGLDVSGHRPRQLTQEILVGADLAIAMGFDHRDEIGSRFARQVPLFSEVAFGETRPLPDIWEVIPNWREDMARAERYGEEVIDYIVDAMPAVVEHLTRNEAQ